MIDAKVLSRSFTYNGLKLPDPDPRMTPHQGVFQFERK
jgi:PRTRC genetic system protein C